ncbi:PSD1 and planctomycete cytochrome C domain-containing protein [Akkermansiaceae bacterium]|nr:PSD1 and planctomycete cytochrome C domain-containing protein [Akkermansiaceae bacterium]
MILPVWAEEGPDFSTEILPILSDKCFACHGPDAKKDEVRLDSFEGATEDLGGYSAIDTGKPEDSELLIRIHDKKDPMPPEDAEKQLTDTERELLTKWVKSGGQYAEHWAFVKPVKVEGGSIDGLVEEKLKGKELAPEVDRHTLARRAALVLTGLPPEEGQLDRFLKSGDYGKLVDELLGSERFGEHQARYWLDAVRYGDTHGLHLDNKRGIYPYRDWVVKAFNENLGFDEFITWQLAGDLLENPTLAQRVATGYVRMNVSTSEGGAIPAEFQAKNNFDRTENFGTVFLGMTLNCARCHTHKYDPIVHEEYYQLMAFLNSTSESPMDGNKYEYKPVMKAPANAEAWKAWDAHVKKRETLMAQKGDNDEELKKLDKEKAQLEKGFTTTLVAEDLKKKRETRVLRRGEYSEPMGDPVEPGVFKVMNSFPEGAPKNRLGLARWTTSPENPLVARVLVNRFWQAIFGAGLVRSPEDFGLQGRQPTHPKLLDWLAVEFQENDWDYKRLIKMMVMSRTFRQDSARRADLNDPQNLLLGRGPSYRLDAEVIRDVGLWAGGLMDETMGGEGVKPFQPEGMWAALSHPASNTKKYVADKDERVFRRSLYVYWKRTSPHPMMTLFDVPSREASCVRRTVGNTPLQSLGLLNEPQRVAMAQGVAKRLLTDASTDPERVDQLFQWVACRKATGQEQAVCLKLLTQARDRYGKDAAAATALGGEGNDALEKAAWTQLAGAVLASDTTILLY